MAGTANAAIMPSIPGNLCSFFLTMSRIACRITVFIAIAIPFLAASLELYLDLACLRHFFATSLI
jgi:hypothetical protein